MTTIAWDGKTLAADKRAVQAGLPRTVTKIVEGDGALLGFSGELSLGMELFVWWHNGRIRSAFPATQRDQDSWGAFVVVGHDGVWVYERSPEPFRVEDKLWAAGSGRDFALMAMYLGNDAKTAVELASGFDIGTGNGVDVLTLT